MTTSPLSMTTSTEDEETPLAEFKPYGTVRITNKSSAFFNEVMPLEQFFPPAGYREGNRSAWVRHPEYGTLSFSDKDVEILEIHYYATNENVDDNPDRLQGDENGW